ncbi:MAG: magnesium transporter [Gammaproteobacteria bacterium]|nr:magnesium transporter [Gammaproteobacteria bacterium]
MDTTETNSASPNLDKLNEALLSGSYPVIRNSLEILSAADLADLLETSPVSVRTILWNIIPLDRQADILPLLDDTVAGELLVEKSFSEIADVLESVDSDEVADILQKLPDTITQQVLESMDEQNRSRVENLLSYPEDTAGGLMDADTISVPARVTLDVVFRYLRRHSELPPMTDTIYVTNSRGEFIGMLPISRMLISDPHMTVREIMDTYLEPIPADMPRQEVTSRFEKYDLVSAPVVDSNNRLLGRITIDDVVDAIIDEADHSILAPVGLTEEDDMFAPILKTSRVRAIWLGANLFTAFLASAVINIFEETISKVVALAVLMPIVASMGGVAGTQTLTLVIRNMAQTPLIKSNERWLLNRELSVGLINGLLWASVVAIGASLVFGDYYLGLIIALALVINLVVAALSGALLPRMLKKMGIDPAIAGTVVLTTITDVVGFMSFLGFATLFYS